MHKEDNKLHTKFIKWQVLCIPSFLQKGLGGEKRTGVEPQAVFEWDTERKKERTERATERQERAKVTKIALMKAIWGQKSKYVDRKCVKSFFKNVLLAAARSTFLKKCDAKSELDHKNHERGILKLAFLMQVHIKSWSA